METVSKWPIASTFLDRPEWLKHPEEEWESHYGPDVCDSREIACQAVWYNERAELNSDLLKEVVKICAEPPFHSMAMVSPLCYAAQIGDRTIMQLFLDANWPVNGFFLSEGSCGGAATVPLCYSAASGNLTTTKMLLEAGAQPDLPVVNGRAEGIKLVTVLDGEADYFRDFNGPASYLLPDGATPLSIALWEGHEEVFQAMLQSFPTEIVQIKAAAARDFALKTIQEWPEVRPTTRQIYPRLDPGGCLKMSRVELTNQVNSLFSRVAARLGFQ